VLRPETRARAVQVVVGDGDSEPAVAFRGELPEEPPQRVAAGHVRIDDREQLEVVVAQRDDPVRRAPREVSSAGDRREPMIFEQPLRSGIQVTDGQDDVIDRARGSHRVGA